MIPYNLKEEKYKNHPMDGKYGMIVTNTVYAKYPVTIVDNHEEVVNGKFTHKPALCLLHLSEDVRTYTRLKLFDEFLYVNFSFGKPTYRMYEYSYEELSNERIIKILKNVLYYLQPSLQSRSLVGSSSDRLEDDPNYYEGQYVLNDENEYTILKCKTKYKFFKGNKSYYPNWSDTEDLIYEGDINFDVYKHSLELQKLKNFIVTGINQILDDETNDSLSRYKDLDKKVKEMIKENISINEGEDVL